MNTWLSNTTTLAPPASNNSGATKLGSLPWHLILPIVTISYLALVRALRFRALRQLQAKYAAYLPDPYRLTYRHAQEIMQLTLLHDTPFLFAFGTQWALVKSFGIASGTPLLVKTRQLADPRNAGKRAEDTAVFISEFLCGDIDGERGRLAMAKLNWMHRRYDIRQADYVHTLALFVLEPQAWIDRYEWRGLTQLEKVAHFLYWREIGARMGIAGIPDTLEGLRAWKDEYERENLYYAESNRIVTDATVDVFLRQTPRFLHGVVRSLFVAFIAERRVREALGFPDPPAWATVLTFAFFHVRGWAIRHLFLPRGRKLDPLAKPGPDGRLYRSPDFVGFEPWYVADTWYNRLSLWWKSGGTMSPGREYQCQGFLPEELGPAGLNNIAKKAVRSQAAAMKNYAEKGGSAAAGCPFNFGW